MAVNTGPCESEVGALPGAVGEGRPQIHSALGLPEKLHILVSALPSNPNRLFWHR